MHATLSKVLARLLCIYTSIVVTQLAIQPTGPMAAPAVRDKAVDPSNDVIALSHRDTPSIAIFCKTT
jgi:hypothetical protein